MNDIQPMPEEIIDWINSIHSNGEKKTGNWKSGAFAMYNKMQAELESLRKERDYYRVALEKLKGWTFTTSDAVHSAITKVLIKYPTEQIESHDKG